MPVIRSISDMRNKSREIERICRRTGEPVFITRNGESDLVVMSSAAYERDHARLELYEKLDEAERSAARGDRGITVAEARRRLLTR